MSQTHLQRVRRICATLPETEEKLSHGEPTFFVRKKVYAMFANHHHNDGRLGVWLPAPPGMQSILIENAPEKFFKPPYVGVRGWIGIELTRIEDGELASHLYEAWRLIAPKRLQAEFAAPASDTAKPPPERHKKSLRASAAVDKTRTK